MFCQLVISGLGLDHESDYVSSDKGRIERSLHGKKGIQKSSPWIISPRLMGLLCKTCLHTQRVSDTGTEEWNADASASSAQGDAERTDFKNIGSRI